MFALNALLLRMNPGRNRAGARAPGVELPVETNSQPEISDAEYMAFMHVLNRAW
jgi:hypothetical protein